MAEGESKVAKDDAGGEVVRAGREQAGEGDEDEEDADALALGEQDEEEGAKSRVVSFIKLHHLLSLADDTQWC